MNLSIIFLIALCISAVGFIKYVYFFSVGYGFAISGIAIALLISFRGSLTAGTIGMCLFFIVYGLRLGGYLLLRELKRTFYKDLLKNEIKDHVKPGAKIAIWVSCAFLYLCQTAPVLFRMKQQTGEASFWMMDGCLAVGLLLMCSGILVEALADWQKSKEKQKAPKMFVHTGLYQMVRCPNYFGELLLWTGVFLSGIPIYTSPLEWILAVLGFLGITYVMFSGARRLELRQDKNYGHIPEYQQYVKSTPIMIPFLPMYSVKKYKWLVA